MDKKTVLITGANSGFGYLTALKFARNGWEVFATTRDLEKDGVKDMNKIAQEENLFVEWLVLDVTDKEAVKNAVRQVEKLDVLVNNAGFGIIGPIESYTVDDFRKQFDANFFGLVDVTYNFLPLIKQGRGTIINISSIAGIIAAPAYALYSSSKHAVEVFSEVLRYELSDTGVKVAMIEPGGFDTNFGQNAAGLNASSGERNWFERAKSIRENSILGSQKGFFKGTRDPSRVVNRIFAVANSENPRLRNIVGFGTPLIAFLRRVVPDWLWEFVVVSALRRLKK